MYRSPLALAALVCPLLACSGLSLAQTDDGTVATPTEPSPELVEGDTTSDADAALADVTAIVERTVITALPEGLRPCADVPETLYPSAQVELPPLLLDTYVPNEALSSIFGMLADEGPQRAEVITHIVDSSAGVMWRLADENGDGEVDDSAMEVLFDDQGRVTQVGATQFDAERTLIYGEFGVVQVAEESHNVTWDFQYTNGVLTRVSTNFEGARVGFLDIVRTPDATVYTATRSADSVVVAVRVERHDEEGRLVALDAVQHEPFVGAQQERWQYVSGDGTAPHMDELLARDADAMPIQLTPDWSLPTTSSGWLEEHFALVDSPSQNANLVRTTEVEGAIVEDEWLVDGDDAPFWMVRTRIEGPAWTTTVRTHQYSEPQRREVVLEQWYCGPLSDAGAGVEPVTSNRVDEVVAISPSWTAYAEIRQRLERQLVATPTDLDASVRAEADRIGSSPDFDVAFEQYASQRASLASDDARATVESLQEMIGTSTPTVNALDDVIDSAGLAACAQLLSGQLLLSLAETIMEAPDTIGDDEDAAAAYEQAISAYLDQFLTEARNRFHRVGQMRQSGLVEGYCAETAGTMMDVDVYSD